MENDSDTLFSRDYFQTSFKKEDVSKLPLFKKWLALQENSGKKVVRCPHC